MKYYKAPIIDGKFVGIDYSKIEEGIAFNRHVESGYGYVATLEEHSELTEVDEEIFKAERM